MEIYNFVNFIRRNKKQTKIRTFQFEKRRYLPYCCLDTIKKYRCASGHTFKLDSLKITSTVNLRSAIREMYFSQTSLRVYFINR